jgi:hypothetical protein
MLLIKKVSPFFCFITYRLADNQDLWAIQILVYLVLGYVQFE